MSAMEQPADMLGRTTFWCGCERMSADSAMKWTPQKTMSSGSGRSGAQGALGVPRSQFEGIAAHVGELDDVLPLVVVAEDDAARAQLAARLGDAGDDPGGVETPVLLRDVLLPEGEGALLGERSRQQGAIGRALHRLVEEGLLGHEGERFSGLM